MRNARKLLLPLAATLGVMAIAASSASALSAVNEDTAVPCPAVSGVTGGCLIHARAEDAIEFRKHVFGIESHITDCTNEFKARLNSSTIGNLSDQLLGNGAGHPPCTRQACAVSGVKTPWPVTGLEGSPIEGTEFLNINFCIEPIGGGTDEKCEIDIPLQSSGDHAFEFGHASEIPAHGITGFRCEIIGHWNTEDTDGGGSTYDDVELTH